MTSKGVRIGEPEDQLKIAQNRIEDPRRERDAEANTICEDDRAAR
jgi:hypothetical protein